MRCRSVPSRSIKCAWQVLRKRPAGAGGVSSHSGGDQRDWRGGRWRRRRRGRRRRREVKRSIDGGGLDDGRPPARRGVCIAHGRADNRRRVDDERIGGREVSQCSKSGAEAEVSLSLALDLFGNWQVRASHGRLFDSSNWLNDLPDLHYLYTLQLRLLTRNINVPATPSLSGTSSSSTSATSPQILIERLRTHENLTTTPRTCTGHHG